MSNRKETYQYLQFQGTFKLDQYREDLAQVNDRAARGSPDMRHVVRTDIKRNRDNQLYDRQLNQHVIGARGLQWQHKSEFLPELTEEGPSSSSSGRNYNG